MSPGIIFCPLVSFWSLNNRTIESRDDGAYFQGGFIRRFTILYTICIHLLKCLQYYGCYVIAVHQTWSTAHAQEMGAKIPDKKVTINFSKFQLIFSNFDQIKRADA